MHKGGFGTYRTELRTVYVACSGAAVQGPGEAQRQRVRWGEEEQRSDCAFRPQGGNKGCGACDDEVRNAFPQNSTILPARAAPMRVNPNSFASATDSAVGMALLANTGTPARMTFSTISTGILPLV